MWALDALQGAEDAAANHPPRAYREQMGGHMSTQRNCGGSHALCSSGRRGKYGEGRAVLDVSAREEGF